MSNKQKRNLGKIIIAAILFLAAKLIPWKNFLPEGAAFWVQAVIFMASYLTVGWEVLRKAFTNILHGQVFDENFLMTVATFGALALGEFAEAVAVMLFYQIGEFFQDYAVGRSRESIAAMMDLCPEYANRVNGDDIEEVAPEEIEVDDLILVKPGERVPLDGIVVEGESRLDTAALTGESVPQGVKVGDDIYSGSVNLNGVLKVRVTKPYGESTVARILELVENASDNKSRSENFITRFSQVYTPTVVISAVLLAVIPPLLFRQDWGEWVHRALIFLVVSCPCALVISVPLSFFGGIGAASRKGILVKGSNYLEALAQVKTIVFDKTGTLTKGTFSVTAVHPDRVSESELLEHAAYAEAYSTHPIAESIKTAYGKEIDNSRIGKAEEISGMGIRSVLDGKEALVGNMRLMNEYSIPGAHDCELTGTIIHAAVDGQYAGHIIISDTVKEDSVQALRDLKQRGVKKTVMLTGDKRETAEAVAAELGIDELHAELLPQNKVEILDRIIKAQPAGEKTAFVGDGINDAPVLTRADVGIAMGAMGSDAAIEAADVVLMNDKPSDIVKAIDVARKTLRIAYENIWFALGVKILVLILAAFGAANMWMAVFADVGVTVIAIINAMRCLK